jgi:predicted MFS family arabinose efflux permease
MTDRASAVPAEETAIIDAPGPTVLGAHFSDGYRTYVLVVMTLVYVVNYLDRQILGILAHPIKVEFHLSDFQVGILGGPAFAVVYSVLGIPIAIFADRLNRRNVIAASLVVFSFMTLVCGFAVQYWQLVLARFGTGVGEAGTSPSINSVLADLYPPEKRASALAFYSAGLNIGLLIAFFGGGWIAQHYGWRQAFLTAGIPGLLLGILVLLTVREPRRGMVENLVDTAETPNLWAVIRVLWRQPSFRWIALGTGMSSFGGYAGITFIPSFLVISHHMTLSEIGVALSLLTGAGGAIGTYMAGVFADRYGKTDIRWNMYVPIVATFVAIPFAPIFYLAPSTAVSLLGAIVPAMMGAAYIGPAYSMTQSLVPLRMRARAIAILLFILNMIGLGLGPPGVGEISDLLKPVLGADSLRWALLSTVITALVGAFCYWRASRTLKADLAKYAA